MNTLRALLSIVLVTASFASAACTTNVTESPKGTSPTNPPGSSTPVESGSSIAGSYAGRYSGDSTGAVTMSISGSAIDVVVTVGAEQYPASGEVTSSGNVNLGVGTANGVTVTFQGAFASNKGSGTWQSTIGTKGTWSVTK